LNAVGAGLTFYFDGFFVKANKPSIIPLSRQ